MTGSRRDGRFPAFHRDRLCRHVPDRRSSPAGDVMLAQSFLSAADLGITEPQKEALMKTLVLLETGKLKHVHVDELSVIEFPKTGGCFSGEFNMSTFGVSHTCGTIACIAGTAELIGGVEFVGTNRPEALSDLFYAEDVPFDLEQITPAQAATALRSYLTTGDAKWSEAVR